MANVQLVADLLIQGSISAEENAAAEATTDATPRKIAAFDEDGSALNCAPDSTTDNDITVVKAGYARVDLFCCFSGTLSKTFYVEIYKNGAGTGRKIERKLGTGGDVGAAGCFWEGAVSASDVFTVYHWSDDGGTAFTAHQISLAIQGLAAAG